MDLLALLKIVAALCTPPASLAVGAVLAMGLAALGRRRLATTVLALAVAHTVIMAFQPVSDALMGHLEGKAREAARQAAPCCYDAIVVLGGGIAPAHPPETMEPDLNEAADRVWEAARLWKRGVAPRIIVTGGSFTARHGGPPTTEAEAMRVFLVDLGVPSEAIIDEGQALNTIQNIRNVRALVGSGKVALVTSAYHMPRALNLAAHAGLNVAAFPTDYQAVRAVRLPWDNWLPSIDGLQQSTLALREIVALNLDFRRMSLDP
jgi:uncharacterized SAM-binding protein YcdF (DUF218 family)